jgi:hypothetical protein
MASMAASCVSLDAIMRFSAKRNESQCGAHDRGAELAQDPLELIGLEAAPLTKAQMMQTDTALLEHGTCVLRRWRTDSRLPLGDPHTEQSPQHRCQVPRREVATT